MRDQIEALVLSGSLQPGQRLVQDSLAKRFKVAQGVVRESLLELSCRGLVEAIDNFGIFVSKLDGASVVEALEVREVLEGLAARLCCRRANREDIDGLKKLLGRIYSLGKKGETARALGLDRTFHQRIIEIAGSGTLQSVAHNHWTLGLVLKMSFDVEIVHQAHQGIVRAIEGNRPGQAEKLMREHIRSGRAVVEQMVEDGSFTPAWFYDQELKTDES